MNKIKRYWKTLGWSVIMLLLFLLPADNLSKAPSIPFLDKAVHIFMFAVFTWFLVWDHVRARTLKSPAFRIFLTALIVTILFGSAIELLQEISFLGRNAELSDVIFDFIGCLVSLGILAIIYRSGQFPLPKY